MNDNYKSLKLQSLVNHFHLLIEIRRDIEGCVRPYFLRRDRLVEQSLVIQDLVLYLIDLLLAKPLFPLAILPQPVLVLILFRYQVDS